MSKLTKYAAKGGCACKIGPHILEAVLNQLPPVYKDERLLVNMEGCDDAGVFQIDHDKALVQTLDFFTPPVDDPYLFGRIAATNSLSDIYAMGGVPITAMNIVAFPIPLVEEGALGEVLRGAGDTLQEAQVALVGGHSIEDDVPKFGLSVTGLVHPQKIWRNKGAQVGDVIVLTKPLGTGIMNTAAKGSLFPEGVAQAVESMTTLNKTASEVAASYSVHACTDVTGFSLMGHLREMAKASNVSMRIQFKSLPLFKDTIEAAKMGLVPAATYGNRKAISNIHIPEDVPEFWHDIVYDPQTSGGLLLAIPVEESVILLEDLHRAGLWQAEAIGVVIEKGEFDIYGS